MGPIHGLEERLKWTVHCLEFLYFFQYNFSFSLFLTGPDIFCCVMKDTLDTEVSADPLTLETMTSIGESKYLRSRARKCTSANSIAACTAKSIAPLTG